MPVFQRDEADAVGFYGTFLRKDADAHTCGNQIQRRLCGIDGADDALICRHTAGPKTKAIFHIVPENHLRLMGNLLRKQKFTAG